MKKKLYDELERANELWMQEELPPLEDIPEHEFSREFEQKMDALLRKEEKTARWRGRMGGVKRAAAFAVVFLGIAVGGLSTVQALHLPILQTIVSMVQNFTEYQFSTSTGAPEARLGEFTLEYLPQGLEETARQESPSQYVIQWEGPEGEFLILEQQLVTQDSLSVYGVENQGAEVTRFVLHGAEAEARERGGNTSIFWTKDSFVYLLSSSLPMEELRQVAEGIVF